MDENEYQPELDPNHEHASGWRAYTTLGLFLEEDGWFPVRIHDRVAYRIYFQGSNVDLRCIAQIKLEGEYLVMYAFAPIKVQEDQRPLAAEYLTRANYGLPVGNFELDWNDGEVRFKSGIDFADEILTFNWIRNTIYPAVNIMNRYFPGLMMVIYGDKTPAEAVAIIEE